MKGNERHQLITERLREDGYVEVAELAATTGASEMTVRRDLDQMAALGLLRRVRGGAAAVHHAVAPFPDRLTEAGDAKSRIADAVAKLLADHDSVVLDSGTTCLKVARRLRERPVTVMPMSLHAVTALADAPTARLLVPGGEPQPGELSLRGPLAVRSLRALRFDAAVVSPSAFTVGDGLATDNLADADIKQAMLAVAARVIVVADGSKWGRRGFAHVCPVDRVTVVVTDDRAPADQRDELTARGVQVITC
ncbi:DeoR/GlpR family DNA-binding transcription regulator [Streptomyces sp. NPDC051183]|uniref:DeoR/GlpR family DNA-binding transcription regulator n=1 Tax=unclassified Streptomyces TaxID=2593676 RepID=UPI00341B1EC6